MLKEYETRIYMAALLAGIWNMMYKYEAFFLRDDKHMRGGCLIPMHHRYWQTEQDFKAQAQKSHFLLGGCWFLTELAMFSLLLHTYKLCMACQPNKVSLNWDCFLIMVYDNTCGNSLPSIKLQRWNWLEVSERSGKQCSRKKRIQRSHS